MQFRSQYLRPLSAVMVIGGALALSAPAVAQTGGYGGSAGQQESDQRGGQQGGQAGQGQQRGSGGYGQQQGGSGGHGQQQGGSAGAYGDKDKEGKKEDKDARRRDW